LAACRKALVAVSLGLPSTDSNPAESGSLVVSVVDPPQAKSHVLTIPQRRDDSLSFDFACSGSEAGLAVWDETAAIVPGGAPSRGVVRAAAFELGHPGARVRDVSPSDSDAEMPRVLPNAAGFFVLWIARRPEPQTSDLHAQQRAGQSALEVAGEARAYGWLEMTSVDSDGSVLGPVRRLTPTSGHVSAYDARALAGSRPGVWVVARDDGESVDAVGGTLVRVRAFLDGADAPLVLPTDGLGRGPPTFVDGPAPWLTWVSPREQLRLLPLGSEGELDAAASGEDALEEARPLVSLASAERVLVATPHDPSAQLRVFECRR
jgi:hypothetical protein